jgi:hypothetical protein
MDPGTLIAGALAAGAVKGVGETASTAVKDAYQGLRKLVSSRFAGKPAAEVVLAEHETDPDTYQAPLIKQVRESGAAEDAAIIEAAQRLMALLDHVGSGQGKYVVDLTGAQGVQVGDHNRQVNMFGRPPRPE